MKKKLKKIINANFLVTITSIFFTLLSLEIICRFIYKPPNLLTNTKECFDDITGFNYCPNYTYERDMSIEGVSYNKVVTKTNNNKIAIDNEFKKIDIDNADIIIIGDSFIQADEIEVKNRIGGLLRRHGYKALEIGFSNWGIDQYYQIINNYKFKKDSKIFVFLMLNDFVSNENRKKLELNKNKENSYKEMLKNSYLIYYSYNFFKIIKSNIKESNFKKNIDNYGQFAADSNNICIEFKKYDYEYEKYVKYLFFSKNENCWPQNLTHEVTKLKNLLVKLNSKNINISYFLIPPGWSFKNENSKGRLSHEYGFPNNIKITQRGLYRYLNKYMNNIYDLEEVLMLHAIEKKDKDQLYFMHDGHWTEKSHKIISDYLINNNFIH